MNKYHVFYYEYNEPKGSNKPYPYGGKVAERFHNAILESEFASV